MSSTATSSSAFQLIFDAALSDYSKQTGIDLASHPFAQSFQTCDSTNSIIVLFQDRSKQFQEYRDGNRRLIDCLKPVVQVLHTVAGILGEAASLVRLGNRPVLSDHILISLFLGAIPTSKGHPRWRRCPPRCTSNPYLPRISLLQQLGIPGVYRDQHKLRRSCRSI
jgi:hypothetical protein